ncbi:MAG: hypothetical protein LLG14_27370 [Nocardiaceae bacterium]|nr:hypothetical protein [Nocardiaceae bacterium]
MRFTVYYNVPMKVEFDSDAENLDTLESHALWWARNKSGAAVGKADLVQILPAGVKSELLRDQPPERGPLDPPPMPPLGSAGDLKLAAQKIIDELPGEIADAVAKAA